MDRRINDRHAIQVKTILSFADTPAKECRTLNVSGGGAFIMTSKPKPVGSKLYMSFLMDAKPNDQIRKKTVINLEGSVRRTTPYGIAVCFEPCQADDLICEIG